MSEITPEGLFREAKRRYAESMRQEWGHASPRRREKWWRRAEPVLRAEYGIAADAVWTGQCWVPAGQLDLFAEPDRDGGDRA